MKKILSMLLALVLVFSMATVALAADGDIPYGQAASFTVKYDVKNGTAPAETFSFTCGFEGFVDNEGTVVDKDTAKTYAPSIALGTAAFNALASTSADNTQSVSVTPTLKSDTKLGKYTYKITQNVPETKAAGVTYTTTPLYLVLTVLYDAEKQVNCVAAIHFNSADSTVKTGEIVNIYEAGSLKVSKTIAGEFADMGKKFPFTITLTAPEGTSIKSSITSDANSGTMSGTTYTIDLGHDESVTLSNIPAGTTYTVTEEKGKYTATSTWSNETAKKITNGTTDTVAFTNTLSGTIDTGVITESAPYILLIAVCAVAAVMFVVKRRRVEF